MEPINYLSQVADPFAQATQGLRLGAGMVELQQKQAAAEQQKLATQQYNQALLRLQSPKATAADFENMIMISGKDQAANLKTVMESRNLRQNQAVLNQVSPIAFALKTGNVEQGITLLKQQAEAARNSGDTQEATYLTQMAEQAKSQPENVGNLFASKMTLIPGGKDALDNLLKLTQERRVEAEAPSKLSEQVAKASKALTAAEVAVATAPDDIARAKALRKFEQAKATKETVDARYADRKNKLNIRKLERELTSEGKNDGVQSSKITPDGTSIIVTKSGNTRVIGADGVELTGQARVDAVRGSEVFGAGIQGLRSGSRKAGEIGQVEAQKAFVTLGKIATNISNLDSAVAALDAGATTGVIASKFPNWKASTIELQNIQRNLGLDIIGSVTFGALSEGELSLALETALPLNMNEKQLKDWLIRKKDAQVKLSKYITEQARFLSVPGQTIGQWLQKSEKIGGRPGGMTAPGTGSTVTVDY